MWTTWIHWKSNGFRNMVLGVCLLVICAACLTACPGPPTQSGEENTSSENSIEKQIESVSESEPSVELPENREPTESAHDATAPEERPTEPPEAVAESNATESITPPDDTRPYGLQQRTPNTTCAVQGTPPNLEVMQIRKAFPNLPNFTGALYLVAAPDGTNRIFVIEQPGIIRVFDNQSNVSTTQVYLDIRSKTSRASNEEGLLGLAFHPQYKTNGYFYVYYSFRDPNTHYSIVSRFKVSAQDPNQADSTSEFEIFRIEQPYGNHNGGMISFGPDGYLYIALGDGGSGGDPHNHGQNLSTLLGAILRIDVNKPSGNLAYTIPPDNPFVQRANARGEIWAYGLRNVWRFSFDRLTGDLWAGDVGQSQREEIDLIVKGGNYGWRRMEGTLCYDGPCNPADYIAPIVEHDRNDAKSITGGYVYRGKKIPQLYGAYVYGDFVTGKIWALRYDGKKVTEQKFLVDTFKGISSFGEDRDGELYFTSFENASGLGHIYTLEPKAIGNPSSFPLQLSQTGCFTTLRPLKPAPGVIPYDVNVPLWSDHLDKQRWFALPGNSQIQYKDTDGWGFPDNTVVLKHFSIQQTKGNEASRKFVETRILVKQQGEWRGYSYLWNAEQTDAFLLDGNSVVSLEQKDPANPGQSLLWNHIVPNRTECLQCHTQAAGRVLGLETMQMNREFDYNGTIDNQLRAMNHIGLFNPPLITDATQRLRLPTLTSTATTETKARAYLHANCAYCHRPGVEGVADTDLRFTTPFVQTKTCNVSPVKGNLGDPGAKILLPGKPDQSTLFLRTQKRGAEQMPQIGTQLPDQEAIALLRQWILNLSSCP